MGEEDKEEATKRLLSWEARPKFSKNHFYANFIFSITTYSIIKQGFPSIFVIQTIGLSRLSCKILP